MEKNEGLLNKIINGFRDMCYIWAKEIRSTITDEGVLIFFILVPLGYPLLYSWIYNNEVGREVRIGIVDQAHSRTRRELIRDVDASPDAKVAYYCNSIEEARDLMGKQEVHGIHYFPKDFATKLSRSEQAHVSLYCDMSLMLTYKAIYQTTQAVSSKINSNIQISQSKDYTNRDDEITTKPLDFVEVPIFNSTGGYGNAILPGVLILILQQTLLLGIGLSAGTARENNRFKDLVPVSRHYTGIYRIVLGKSMCYFMIYLVMATFLALVVPKIFSFLELAHPGALIAVMVPYILACIFFAMTISCLVRYRENVILLVVFTSLPLFFISGLSWPGSNIPEGWKIFSVIFPSTFGINAYMRVNSLGANLEDVLFEYRALWLQVGFYFLTACIVYRRQIIISRKHALQRLEYMKKKKKVAQKHKRFIS